MDDQIIQITVSSGPSLVEMPDIIGFTQANASKKLDALGIQYKMVMVDNDGTMAAGCVASTDYKAGTKINTENVTVIVSIAGERDDTLVRRRGMRQKAIRLPLRGKLSPKVTDEGQVFRDTPLTGDHRNAAPHPAAGPPFSYALRAAFGGCAPTRACGRSPKGEGEAKQKEQSRQETALFLVHFQAMPTRRD